MVPSKYLVEGKGRIELYSPRGTPESVQISMVDRYRHRSQVAEKGRTNKASDPLKDAQLAGLATVK